MPKRIFIKDGGLTSSVPVPAGYTVLGSINGTPKKQVQSTISDLSGFTRYLGEQYLGGIIFNLYTGSDGQQHGQVVSLTETNTSLQDPPSLVGASSSWDGATNTSLYTNSLAKTWVESLGEGWYIPSIDEINTLYNNKYHVNKAISALGSDLLSNALYWSSTELDYINVLAFYFNFGVADSSNKDDTACVRAVKSF